MKSLLEPKDVERLLDAVLVDENWQVVHGSLKCEALEALGAGRRHRRVRLWIGQAMCAAMILLGAGWWLHSQSPSRLQGAAVTGQPASAGAEGTFITEEQMLAMFPPGSCVVAEIDGRKELVFLDKSKAREGFVLGKQ